MDSRDIEDMFSCVGSVSIRRMFGGKGAYHRDRIVAVEVGGEMLLKADSVSAPAFAASGARRWIHEGRPSRSVEMPYWTVPDDAYDDPDTMARWVRLAWAAALRGGTSKPRRGAAADDAV